MDIVVTSILSREKCYQGLLAVCSISHLSHTLSTLAYAIATSIRDFLITSITLAPRSLATPATSRATCDTETGAGSVSVLHTLCSDRLYSTDWSQCGWIAD